MEFKVFQKEIELQSRGWVPTFHDITTDVLNIVKESGIKNGTCTIASHHTTCSVMIQECSHDFDTFDLEYLQHDLLDIMRKMIPDYVNEGDYRHPGPVHAQFGRYVDEPGNFTSMNTDGHLRSVLTTSPLLYLRSLISSAVPITVTFTWRRRARTWSQSMK